MFCFIFGDAWSVQIILVQLDNGFVFKCRTGKGTFYEHESVLAVVSQLGYIFGEIGKEKIKTSGNNNKCFWNKLSKMCQTSNARDEENGKKTIFKRQTPFWMFFIFPKAKRAQILRQNCAVIYHQEKKCCTWMKPLPKQVSDTDGVTRMVWLYTTLKWLRIFSEFGLFNYVLIFVSAVILYAVGYETCAILYVIPVSQCDLNLNSNQKGILASATFFGIICSSHLWGFLGDLKGRRRVMLPSMMVAFCMSIICSFMKNFYIFTTLRFLNGFL